MAGQSCDSKVGKVDFNFPRLLGLVFIHLGDLTVVVCWRLLVHYNLLLRWCIKLLGFVNMVLLMHMDILRYHLCRMVIAVAPIWRGVLHNLRRVRPTDRRRPDSTYHPTIVR